MLHENVGFELKVKHFCHRMVVAKESEDTRHGSCWEQTHNIAVSWEQVIALFFSTYKNWDIRGSGKLMSSKRKDFRCKAACFMLQGCELHRWVKWSQWANWMNGWYRKLYRSGEKQQCPDLLSATLITTLTPSSMGRKSLFHLPLYGPLSGEAEVGTQAVKIPGAKNWSGNQGEMVL